MDPGIYRVVLGGGDSNASGGRLTYNFRLKQFAEYSLCAGANAEGVSSGCGQRPGAAGSYLKLVINGKDYYFAAGGSGGAGIDCGGPGGGGIGGGGSPGKCTLKAGAAVGPYAGGAVKSSIIGAGGGQGLNAGGFGYGCDSGAGGGGGGDGSSRYGGKGIDITVGTILMNGSFGTFTGRLGSQGCSTTECVNATATHASNTAAETCAACAKLYMIKR
jgi:hypothetical protein